MKKNISLKFAIIIISVIVILIGIFLGFKIYKKSKNMTSDINRDNNTNNENINIIENNENEKNDKFKEKRKIELDTGSKKDVFEKKEVDLEKENYTEEYKKYLELSDEEKSKKEVVPRKFEIDYSELDRIRKDQEKDLKIKHVNSNTENKKEKKEKETDENNQIKNETIEKDKNLEIPSKFDLRDKIDIKIENQGTFGLCWNFTSLTSLETNLALTKGINYDFSESHVDYITSNELSTLGRNVNEGGDFSDFVNYAKRNKGFVLEEEVPLDRYEESEYKTFYTTPSVDINLTKYIDFPLFNKNDFDKDKVDEEFKKFQETIKTHIMNYGSIYCSTRSPVSKNEFFYDIEEKETEPHAVSIIGWDDNYSKENFVSPTGRKPEHDGAYIAANSWGTEWGDKGCFYISYEDCSVHNGLSGVISTDKEDLININKIKNKKLKKYIEENNYDQILKIEGENYLRQDVLGKYKLDLSNLGLKNLNGLELFDIPYEIDLSGNELENVKEINDILQNDKIYNLNLSNNKINDVSELSNKKFENLYLNNNPGIKGYEKLENINYKLSLDNCKIKDISNISNLKSIMSLSLANNNIENFYSIANMEKLFELDLSGNNIKDSNKLLNIFNKKEKIVILNLSNNNLKEINALKDNNSLISLDLSNNQEIQNFEILSTCNSIAELIVKSCNIKNAEVVKLSTEINEVDNEGYIFNPEIIYDLSDNLEIKNISKLKNATRLKLENCNITDVTEFNQMPELRDLDLSGNKNLSGIYKGNELFSLELKNCNLNNNFDFFGITKVVIIDIRENNEIDYRNILNKIDINEIKIDNYVIDDKIENMNNEVNIEAENYIKKIAIPKETNIQINTFELRKNMLYVLNGFDQKYTINGKIYSLDHIVKDIKVDTKIQIENYSNNTLKIEFYINNNIKNNGIGISKMPSKVVQNKNKDIELSDIEVVNYYDNGIQTRTEDYKIKAVKTIFNEKVLLTLSQNEFDVNFRLNENKIDKNLKENFEENKILTLKSKEMYELVKEYWKNYIVGYDENLLKIIIKEDNNKINNDSGVPLYIPRKYLKEIPGLKEIISTEVYMLMDETNGNEMITQEDLNNLEEIYGLEKIYIVTNETDLNKLIINQNKFKIILENGIG